MLFMIIETFRDGNAAAVGERFAQKGRMLPEGVTYHASWVDRNRMRCFQIMEAPNREAIEAWASRWRDLVDFEVIPVHTSAEFWAEADSDKRK